MTAESVRALRPRTLTPLLKVRTYSPFDHIAVRRVGVVSCSGSSLYLLSVSRFWHLSHR